MSDAGSASVPTNMSRILRSSLIETTDRKQRAMEENQLIHDEMNNVLNHYLNQHVVLERVMVDAQHTDIREKRGLVSLSTHKLALVEKKLSRVKQVFTEVGQRTLNIPNKHVLLFEPLGVRETDSDNDSLSGSDNDNESGSDFEDES